LHTGYRIGLLKRSARQVGGLTGAKSDSLLRVYESVAGS
jgi:hypothetical protein